MQIIDRLEPFGIGVVPEGMIPTGTRWQAKKGPGGIFAFTVEDVTSSTPMAEIPYEAGEKMADRALVAGLVARAPLMRDECLAAAARLRASGHTWVLSIAQALEEAAGDR